MGGERRHHDAPQPNHAARGAGGRAALPIPHVASSARSSRPDVSLSHSTALPSLGESWIPPPSLPRSVRRGLELPLLTRARSPPGTAPALPPFRTRAPVCVCVVLRRRPPAYPRITAGSLPFFCLVYLTFRASNMRVQAYRIGAPRDEATSFACPGERSCLPACLAYSTG